MNCESRRSIRQLTVALCGSGADPPEPQAVEVRRHLLRVEVVEPQAGPIFRNRPPPTPAPPVLMEVQPLAVKKRACAHWVG